MEPPADAIDTTGTRRLLLSTSTRDRSDWKGLLALARHLVVLVVCALVVELPVGPMLQACARLLEGVALTFLFCPAHECTHGTAFRSRALNEAIGFGAGLLLILPPYWFRSFHMQHHKHTQDPARDPEIRWSGIPSTDERKVGPSALRTRVWILTGLGYWQERAATTLSYARGVVPAADKGFVHTERMHARLVREARMFACAYALVLGAAAAGPLSRPPSLPPSIQPAHTLECCGRPCGVGRGFPPGAPPSSPPPPCDPPCVPTVRPPRVRRHRVSHLPIPMHTPLGRRRSRHRVAALGRTGHHRSALPAPLPHRRAHRLRARPTRAI